MAQQSSGVVRPVISLVCGVLAVVLIPLSLVAVWASIMLTRTAVFVDELSPVVRQPQVQEALADRRRHRACSAPSPCSPR